MADIYEKLAQDERLIEIDKNSGFAFGADELRMITAWPDQVVEDYLSKTRSLFLVGEVDQDVIDALLSLKIRVDELEGKVAYIEGKIIEIEAQLDWLTPISVTTDSNFVTSGNQFVVCVNPRPDAIIVSLNSSPRDAERVWITRGGYHVTIDGNGLPINGSERIKMKRVNETRAIEFNDNLGAWVIV